MKDHQSCPGKQHPQQRATVEIEQIRYHQATEETAGHDAYLWPEIAPGQVGVHPLFDQREPFPVLCRDLEIEDGYNAYQHQRDNQYQQQGRKNTLLHVFFFI